uniref:Fibronectin type-III domain-containing protein n=1 Tax=Amblyomma maculatum TaxID=34609 RepID=G3MRK9_AMBMU
MTSYHVDWLTPWTYYRIILRPFYTQSGKPEKAYKLGRAAMVTVRTLSSEPEVPGLVSVLSSQQRNVVLNIVGPSAWNSDPAGVHVRWEATNERHGPRGEMDIALPEEWSLDNNVINATLPLPGGIEYRLFVSAVGSSDSGITVRGPEAEVNASVPLDSYDMSANAVDSSRAAVSWRASEIVEYFYLEVIRHKLEEELRTHTARYVEGKEEVTSRYDLIFTNLEPWTFYTVRLKGCSVGNCSAAVNATFTTLPERLPSPEFSFIAATSPNTLELQWFFPQNDRRLYHGFRVRLCKENADSCNLFNTESRRLSLVGFGPGTVVNIDVRARLRGVDGRPVLGPAETASLTMWENVPVASLWNEATIQNADDIVFLSWSCSNSSVDYIQYKTDNVDWMTCGVYANCEATVNNPRSAHLTSGDLRLLLQTPPQDQFHVFVRCCNSFGCGQADSIKINPHKSGPPSLSAVTVFPRGRSAVLRYVPQRSSPYDGIEVTWYCDGNKDSTFVKIIPQSSYYDYKKEKTINGLSTDADQCEFEVALFWDNNGQRYFSFPVPAVPA